MWLLVCEPTEDTPGLPPVTTPTHRTTLDERWDAPDSLNNGRSLHGPPSSSCYPTSLRPQCAGLKPKPCSSSTSSSVSSRLAQLQHSLVWPSSPLKPNMRSRMTRQVVFAASSVPRRTRHPGVPKDADVGRDSSAGAETGRDSGPVVQVWTQARPGRATRFFGP